MINRQTLQIVLTNKFVSLPEDYQYTSSILKLYLFHGKLDIYLDYFIWIICLAKLCGDLGVLADCDTETRNLQCRIIRHNGHNSQARLDIRCSI